jgi:hypothetical protein
MSSKGTVRGLRRRSRVIAVLALGVALGVVITATPASGHITGSVTHVAKHMKNYFYTKSQSNARFAGKSQEAWHTVGAAGEPSFTSMCVSGEPVQVRWTNYGLGSAEFNEVGFYKDSVGVVHLKGLATQDCGGYSDGAGSVIFVLPPGYRPAETEVQVTVANNTVNRINVKATGEVRPELAVGRDTGVWISLDGITFRAGA